MIKVVLNLVAFVAFGSLAVASAAVTAKQLVQLLLNEEAYSSDWFVAAPVITSLIFIFLAALTFFNLLDMKPVNK